MVQAINFISAKDEFDKIYNGKSLLPKSLVPVNGYSKSNISLKGVKNKPLEEYFKWQFIFALLQSGLYKKDFIGVEVHFPKGSKGAKDLEIDCAIFDDSDWINHYNNYRKSKKNEDLQWLNDHLISVVEFKRSKKEIEDAFTRQLKPAMREKDPSDAYIVGIY